jgi:hypothetical protein
MAVLSGALGTCFSIIYLLTLVTLEAAQVSVLIARANVTAITFVDVSFDQNGAHTTGPSIVGRSKQTESRPAKERDARRGWARFRHLKDDQKKQVTVE